MPALLVLGFLAGVRTAATTPLAHIPPRELGDVPHIVESVGGCQNADGDLRVPKSWLEGSMAGAVLLGFGDLTPSGPPVGNTGGHVTNSVLPSVGNGFLSTQWTSAVLYVAGLFNGVPGPDPRPARPNRAALPSSASVAITGASPLVTALNMLEGVVEERSTVSSAPGVVIAHRVYAHRALPNILVVEINATGESPHSITLSDAIFASMVDGGVGSSPDVALVRTKAQLPGAEAVVATARVSDPKTSPITTAAICRDTVPTSITVPGQLTLLSAYVTSRNGTAAAEVVAAACLKLAQARADRDSGVLWGSHVDAWRTLWDRGVQVGGNPALARLVNATLYAVLCSIRADVDYSVSPGGLSTDGYSSFPLHPPLSCDCHITRSVVSPPRLHLRTNTTPLDERDDHVTRVVCCRWARLLGC
eukprot:m.328509 g.328509  ORF g.328509 m.328509 type:complete len:419 (-) comp16502_c1_seq24:1367-2623(-)